MLCVERGGVGSMNELVTGPAFRFADWPNDQVPRRPRACTRFGAARNSYVGMSGRAANAEDFAVGQGRQAARGCGPGSARTPQAGGPGTSVAQQQGYSARIRVDAAAPTRLGPTRQSRRLVCRILGAQPEPTDLVRCREQTTNAQVGWMRQGALGGIRTPQPSDP
jgi:hypothetical protein